MGKRIILDKNQEAEYGARRLKAECHQQHCLDQFHDSSVTVNIQSLLHQKTALDADPFSGRNDQSHSYGSNSQASDLNQCSHHSLSKGRKMIRCVNGNQSGHAHRTGRRKQSVHKGHLYAAAHGNGQKKNKSSKQNHRRKSQSYQSGRRLVFYEFNYTFHFQSPSEF